MIDEEGRPRPILVEVNANVKIHGSKNVVGGRAVVGHLAQNGGMRRGPEERKTGEWTGSGCKEEGAGGKRTDRDGVEESTSRLGVASEWVAWLPSS